MVPTSSGSPGPGSYEDGPLGNTHTGSLFPRPAQHGPVIPVVRSATEGAVDVDKLQISSLLSGYSPAVKALSADDG